MQGGLAGDRQPSLSLFRFGGMWFWKDHGTQQSGNALHLLLTTGYDKQSAVRMIKKAEGLETPRPVFRAAEKPRPAPKS